MDVVYPLTANRLLPLTPNQTHVIEALRARNHGLTLSIHWAWRNGQTFPLDSRTHVPGLRRAIWQGNDEAFAAKKKRDNPPLYTGANDLRAWLLWALGEGLTTVEEATRLTSAEAIETWYGDLLLATNYYVNALREVEVRQGAASTGLYTLALSGSRREMVVQLGMQVADQEYDKFAKLLGRYPWLHEEVWGEGDPDFDWDQAAVRGALMALLRITGIRMTGINLD